MQAMITESYRGIDKTKRYGWKTKDQPGELVWIDKSELQIHPDYQREVLVHKVTEITANWSWVGAGAISVGLRDGAYWVIDGQHRVLAAKRTSDIKELPCIVFETEDVKTEASAFLTLNANRKPVSAIDKYRAMLAAEDATAIEVDSVLRKLDINLVKTATKAGQFKSIGWALQRCIENKQRFELVLALGNSLSKADDCAIKEMLLDGLWYIDVNVDGGIQNRRLLDRIKHVGAARLVSGAQKASAFFVMGGANVWAKGMLEEINKGLQKKFVLNNPK